jgi:hypothetical protein
VGRRHERRRPGGVETRTPATIDRTALITIAVAGTQGAVTTTTTTAVTTRTTITAVTPT